MKSILYLLICTLITYSCSDSIKKQKVGIVVENYANKTDTTVSSVTYPDNVEKEYFLIINNDTSQFSLFAYSISGDNVGAKFGIGSSRKISNYAGDSLAVEDELKAIEKPLIKKFVQQIVELQVLINAAAKDFNLQKLSHIRFSISDIDGFSESITEQYIANHGFKFNTKSNQNTCTLIKQSAFVIDLNRTLSPYNLMIDGISIDGLVYNKNKGSTQELLDGMLVFNLKANK